jgi:hypothetical protein
MHSPTDIFRRAHTHTHTHKERERERERETERDEGQRYAMIGEGPVTW